MCGRDAGVARISHQPGAVVDSVPLLRKKQCRRKVTRRKTYTQEGGFDVTFRDSCI